MLIPGQSDLPTVCIAETARACRTGSPRADVAVSTFRQPDAADLMRAGAAAMPCGGAVSLARLAGNVIQLDSAGGDIDVGVCYGDRSRIDSGGGAIAVKQMNSPGAEGRQALHSGGGHISVGGLDGSALLDSGAGDVTLQVPSPLRCLGALLWHRRSASSVSRSAALCTGV